MHSWQIVVYQIHHMRTFSQKRREEMRSWVLYCWQAWIWREKSLYGKQVQIVSKSMMKARRSTFTRWEQRLHLLHTQVLQRKQSSVLSSYIQTKRITVLYHGWKHWASTLTFHRKTLGHRGERIKRDICRKFLAAWFCSVQWLRKALAVQGRMVCRWAFNCMRNVLCAWDFQSKRNRKATYILRKSLTLLTRKSVDNSVIQWTEYVRTKSKHSRLARCIRKSVSTRTLGGLLVCWHHTARLASTRDRCWARLCLSQTHRGVCADRAKQRVMLSDWQIIRTTARGSNRLVQALATRWISKLNTKIFYAWHGRSRQTKIILNLNSKIRCQRSQRAGVVIMSAWRCYTAEFMCWRDGAASACHLWHGTLQPIHKQRGLVVLSQAVRRATCISRVLDLQRRAQSRAFLLHVVYGWHQEARGRYTTRHRSCELAGTVRDRRSERSTMLRWTKLSNFHAHLTRASDVLIFRTIAKALRKAFFVWGIEWEHVARRCRAALVCARRHSSFSTHDIFKNWARRMQQSSRYWATVERRFTRYMSQVVLAWLKAAFREGLLANWITTHERQRKQQEMGEFLGVWRRRSRVISRAFSKSSLIMHRELSAAFWKWALARPGVPLDTHQREVAKLLNSACKTAKGRDLLRAIVRERASQRSIEGQ